MNNAVRTTLSNIFTVLCCVVVILGLVSLAAVGIGIRPFVMISESMHPEVSKGSLVLINTYAPLDKVEAGDNVAYIVGKVEAMHKVVNVSSDELVVRALADDGETAVTASTYLGKQVLAIPGVGGWIQDVLKMKWAVIGLAAVLIVLGCIPRKNGTAIQGIVKQD